MSLTTFATTLGAPESTPLRCSQCLAHRYMFLWSASCWPFVMESGITDSGWNSSQTSYLKWYARIQQLLFKPCVMCPTRHPATVFPTRVESLSTNRNPEASCNLFQFTPVNRVQKVRCWLYSLILGFARIRTQSRPTEKRSKFGYDDRSYF